MLNGERPVEVHAATPEALACTGTARTEDGGAALMSVVGAPIRSYVVQNDLVLSQARVTVQLQTRGSSFVITDEVLLALVPPAMTKAQGGGDAWQQARRELVDAFADQEAAGQHYRAAVIAHYVGFLSINDPAEQLRWHQAAWEHAQLADQSDVASFLPSLLASVGASHLAAGDRTTALEWYERAVSNLDALRDDDYGTKIRQQVLKQVDELRAAR